MIQSSTKRPLQIEIKSRDGDLENPHPQHGSLGPQFQRHRIASVLDFQLLQRGDAIRFESTEGIGQRQAQAMIDLGGDRFVDKHPLRRRFIVAGILLQITAPRNHVDVSAGSDEPRNPLGLVLPIAIERHDEVESLIDRKLKCCLQRRPIASVDRMSHNDDIVACVEQFRGTIGRSIIDGQDMICVAAHFVQHPANSSHFIEDRQCRQPAFGHRPPSLPC